LLLIGRAIFAGFALESAELCMAKDMEYSWECDQREFHFRRCFGDFLWMFALIGAGIVGSFLTLPTLDVYWALVGAPRPPSTLLNYLNAPLIIFPDAFHTATHLMVDGYALQELIHVSVPCGIWTAVIMVGW
jgi:hypothetical protein